MLSPPISTIPPPSSATRHQPPHSPETLASLITTSKNIRQFLQIHAAAIRHGHDNHPIVNFKLQRSYSSFGRLDSSRLLFNRTHNPDVFFYTSIIHAHAVDNLHTRGLQFYIQMLSQDVNPNEFTLSAVLKGCSLEHGKPLHSHAIKLGFDCNMHVRTALVDVYSKYGDLISARQLFDKMPERSLVSLTSMIKGYVNHGDLVNARKLFDEMLVRDSVSWNVMISGYAKFGKPTEALTLFRKMLTTMNADEVTIVAVLSACGQIGALESGKWVHSHVNSNRIPMNVHVGTALIDMYCKCGSLDDARSVFDSLENKDTIAYNSMIGGYAMHGCCQEALILFSKMRRGRRTRPTEISFIGVLNACAHSGLVSIGKGVFLSMKTKHGIEPSIEHYGCIVNLLGRAGFLDTAYGVVKKMTAEPDPVIWGTLLDSCSLHGNVRLAEEIVTFLIDRGLANSGSYILLSNLYAANSNWAGVARMRAMMKDHGVRKEPGCSSIEVCNTVHEFVAGDVEHPNREEIYTMLEEMNGWLAGCGYVPRTEIVSHDVGKTGKERSLAVHSERLAIAFGLISTEPGSGIKIMKNLRVCSDCHEVTKLISKITGRRIVVRDRNRFHHFEDGSCSCGDYW